MPTAADFVNVARSQIGYKESPANSNKTKYGEWYGMNGQPWCDIFVTWCANQCGGLSLTGGKFAYTPSHANWFKSHGQWLDRAEKPQPGDLVFFHNSSRICHVGIVTARNGTSSVSTIEGNTSASSNANGGMVMERTRTYGKVGSSWYIAGFGRPKWNGTSSSGSSSSTTPVQTKPSKPASSVKNRAIANVQAWVNSYAKAGIAVDGVNGPQTKRGLCKAYQKALNDIYGAGLAVDGIWGARTRGATRVVKRGSKGNHVKALQGALICLGYSTGGFDGVFGSVTDSAVRSFQRSRGLSVDGQAGKNTFAKLFG